MNNVSLISDLDPEAKNLEGYLFPDTYEFSPETTPAQFIEIMVRRFREVWKPDWTARASSLNRSTREIITTASIIETEAKLAEERPVVARQNFVVIEDSGLRHERKNQKPRA